MTFSVTNLAQLPVNKPQANVHKVWLVFDFTKLVSKTKLKHLIEFALHLNFTKHFHKIWSKGHDINTDPYFEQSLTDEEAIFLNHFRIRIHVLLFKYKVGTFFNNSLT